MFSRVSTSNPVGKIAKKKSKGLRFVNSALKIQCHIVKNTLTDCFFGDFAHWESANYANYEICFDCILYYICYTMNSRYTM